MKSAREIACTDKMGDCEALTGPMTGSHSLECDARTEAIQAAREEMRDAAANVCEGWRCKERCVHLACEALMLAANDIRGLPVAP